MEILVSDINASPVTARYVQPDQAAPGVKRVLIKSDSACKSTCELTFRNNRMCVQFLIGKQFPVLIQAQKPTDLTPFY